MRPRTAGFLVSVAATALFPGCDCDRNPEIYKRATYSGAGGVADKAGAGGGGQSGAGQGGAGQGGAGQGGAGEAGAGQAGAGGNVVDENGCTVASKLVHVLTDQGQLLRFDPPTVTFTKIAKLDCKSASSPYSMAVSRNGTGYSVFQDGTLQKFDVTTGVCEQTPFVPGQEGFQKFGMGFVSKDNADETLFVTDTAGNRLAKIDVTAFKLTKIGDFDQLLGVSSELTGTGAGELFGVFETTPPTIAQIDPLTAKISNTAPQGAVQIPEGSTHFAFAAYGGQFWTFVGPDGGTEVFVYDPVTKLTTKKATITEEIVGAGVSTCAPRTLPGPT